MTSGNKRFGGSEQLGFVVVWVFAMTGQSDRPRRVSDLSILADLEQGYGDVKYTRFAVHKAITNGVSVIHIEVCPPHA